MDIFLTDLAATWTLGKSMAQAIMASPITVPVFFYGDLGMGKTTLINALVSNLPGGEHAEISSPSFTLCNMYPTTPPVAHYDLYRQERGSTDETLLDFLDGQRHVVLVEWSERLPEHALPPVRLACGLCTCKDGRTASFTAFGQEAEHLLTYIVPVP